MFCRVTPLGSCHPGPILEAEVSRELLRRGVSREMGRQAALTDRKQTTQGVAGCILFIVDLNTLQVFS